MAIIDAGLGPRREAKFAAGLSSILHHIDTDPGTLLDYFRKGPDSPSDLIMRVIRASAEFKTS